MAGFFEYANPFVKRESHSPRAFWAYRVLTFITWLLLVTTTFYYVCNVPTDDSLAGHTIFGQNRAHPTPFTLNKIILSIYWDFLFLSQIGYVWALFSSNETYRNAAAGVGSHFILNNLMQFGFVMLFVRSHFWWAELVIVLNFWNLSALYFRHPVTPRFIHISVVSGPLAWNFVALYWNGAIAFHSDTLVARILANVAIWSILVYGLFFLVVYKDYTMGFELSVLTAALGVSQFLDKIIAFQWIFAFVIMAVLFLATLSIAIPGIFGKELIFGRGAGVADSDQERAPLLNDS